MRRFKAQKLNTVLIISIFVFMVAVTIFTVAKVTHVQAIHNPPSVGAYTSGKYRNLFSERGYSANDIQKKLDTTWNQLFYGDDQTERIYHPIENNMAYILDTENKDVRSQGMAFGMMIAVQMNKKKEFDALWKWAKTYMYHSSGDHQGYFAWKCAIDGTKLDPSPTSNSEEWIATALFMASGRWGNGTSIFDYRNEAQSLLHNMLHHPLSHGVTPMFDLTQKQVVFVPYYSSATYTIPSSQLPAYYQLWSYWATEDNQFWADAANASRNFFKTTVNENTGLAPDYANFNGTPNAGTCCGGNHADFRFEAWFVASNIAVDYAWFAADPWQITQSEQLQKFFTSQGLSKYGNQYTLSGKQLGYDHSPGLVAMNAIASLATTDSTQTDAFIDALWKTSIPSGKYRYYDGLLYFIGMLHNSGNFRIYNPPK
jgi:oligosaccharide reducing-end xylanase